MVYPCLSWFIHVYHGLSWFITVYPHRNWMPRRSSHVAKTAGLTAYWVRYHYYPLQVDKVRLGGKKRQKTGFPHGFIVPFKRLKEVTHHYGKSPFFMGQSTISMAMFNSKLLVYQRVTIDTATGGVLKWGYTRMDGL